MKHGIVGRPTQHGGEQMLDGIERRTDQQHDESAEEKRMGAVGIGDAPSDAVPGRRLPLYEYLLVQEGD